MGEDYRGPDPRLQRDVAVKVLQAGQPIETATRGEAGLARTLFPGSGASAALTGAHQDEPRAGLVARSDARKPLLEVIADSQEQRTQAPSLQWIAAQVVRVPEL